MRHASLKRAAVLALALLVGAPRLVTAQADRERGAAALGELIRGLGVTMRVLVIGAHPDDEDTQLITWLARGRGVETAYLSLTRGDGGQNLIGNELGEGLGVIRTEELLAARRIDGGRQYFTRAYDFGFSKSAEETYRHWPKDSILRDVVAVVRAFRPHVIVSVFSGTPRDGHGHHQVAGLLAREAFDVAGDTVRFPRERFNAPWVPLKFYRSARFAPNDATLRFDVGEYSPLIGRSYAEVAAESRSQHKSQGFGVLQRRGALLDYLRLEARRDKAAAAATESSLFDGIDTTWARFGAGVTDGRARSALDSLPAAFRAARESFDAFTPAGAVPALARVRSLLQAICPQRAENACERIDPAGSGGFRRTLRDSDLAWSLDRAMTRVQQALRLASGVAADATTDREVWRLGHTAQVTTAFYNRWADTVAVGGPWPVDGHEHDGIVTRTRLVPPGGVLRDTIAVSIGTVAEPWWLKEPRRGDLFSLPARRRPEDAPSSMPAVQYAVDLGGRAMGVTVDLHEPVIHRYADPVRGEIRRPAVGAPALSLTLGHDVAYAPAGTTLDRLVRVHLRSAAETRREVRVSIDAAAGLIADSITRNVTLAGPRAEADAVFRLRGRLAPGRHTIAVVAESNGERFAGGYQLIEYEHIRPQRVYRATRLEIEAVDVRVPSGIRVAYLPGVSDNVAPAIEQLGIPVMLVSASALPQLDPARTPVLVIGPRAYEANDTLAVNAAAALDFARRGGTVVVQYGQHEMTQPGIMPYPIALERRADRVTEEDAPVRVLDPASAILMYPNRITDRDFAGWVQERSLYMPRSFDARYHAPLSMNDPGEPPNQGAILLAPVGRGMYVYTTLAFFRQLPAGHPGAARLFVNLLAAGQRPARR